VYRRQAETDEFAVIDDGEQTTTAYTDLAYQPGFEYAISAVDRSGNEGERSAPVSAPSNP